MKAIKVAPTEDQIRDRSVWIVEDREGGVTQGSAFFLHGIGLVTAAHCVGGKHKFVVYHPSKASNRLPVSVERYCDHRDLAILGHPLSDNEFYTLQQSVLGVKPGDVVTAMGYPGYGPGDNLNVRPGTIASLPWKSAVRYIEVTQKLANGMSGGPIVDSSQGVIGVICKGGLGEDRDFAVDIRELNVWLAEEASKRHF